MRPQINMQKIQNIRSFRIGTALNGSLAIVLFIHLLKNKSTWLAWMTIGATVFGLLCLLWMSISDPYNNIDINISSKKRHFRIELAMEITFNLAVYASLVVINNL